MGTPATTGQLRTDIASMEIGDYIACSIHGYFILAAMGRNDVTYPEIPVTGMVRESYYNKFYFIKVDEGLLIADRVVYHSISWDVLNTEKVIEGKSQDGANGITGIIRSLTGGVAYADASGNKRTSYTGSVGGWPTNNEWDKYIVNFPSEMVQAGKTLDDVFHWNGVGTFVQDTKYRDSSYRSARGRAYVDYMDNMATNVISSGYAFRPCFEYKE